MKEIVDLAETVKSTLKIDFDAKGVKFLEGFIERTKVTMPKEDWPGLINSCGAFLGQTIIENYGGEWMKEEDGEISVAFDKKNKVFPFSKTRKQFHNGLDDSIYGLYETIAFVFKFPAKKKELWRFW